MSTKLEKVLTNLYEDKSDRFYSHIFFQVDRVSCDKIPTMGVGIKNRRVKLYYNQQFLDDVIKDHGVDHVKTILKHEASHLINKHIFKERIYKADSEINHTIENIAMDCAINQYLDKNHIKDIKGITLDSLKEMLKETKPENVEAFKDYPYYLELLLKEKEEREKKGKRKEFEKMLKDAQMDDHSGLGEQSVDPVDKAIFDEVIKNAVDDTLREGGTIPGGMEGILDIGRGSKIPWQRHITRFVNKTKKMNRKKSRTKRNRRYGIKFPGNNRDFESNILVALDTSGSMSDEDIQNCLKEMYKIYEINNNIGLDIIECDAEITEVFTYNGGRKFKVAGRGGTDFNPALEYYKNNAYDGMIFFTDGGHWGSDLVNPSKDVIWGLVNEFNFSPNFGKVIKID